MNTRLEISLLADYLERLLKIILDYSPKLITALVILFIGLYIIRVINRVVRRIMTNREIDPTLSKFAADILLWILRILLFVTFISKLGIETSSFVAILGAAGLAVGLSLQGSLSNFAGGMLIILFKPFRVGDTIEAQNVTGTVKEIQIFVTKLIAANNQTIFIPNGILSNGVITNHSMQGKRRADLIFSLSYDTNVKEAKDIILKVMQSHPKVLKMPEPVVVVRDLTDTAIHLAIRPWAKNEDLGIVTSDILEQCKLAFDAAKIEIQPYARENAK
ncbi:MAG: mechanosensitive ion channel domain-containing protein [Bacteroidota bacterium]